MSWKSSEKVDDRGTKEVKGRKGKIEKGLYL